MAFVGQGAKQPVLSYFLAEHDPSNRRFKASSSTLEKPSFHEDTTVQVGAPACLSKGSTADDPTLQLVEPPALPRWMSSKQVQNIIVNTPAKSGLTTNVVPSKPMPRLLRQNSQVYKTLGPFCAMPSPKVFDSEEGQDRTGSGVQSTPDIPNSRHLFQQQPPARSPLSVGLSPSQGSKRDDQREELKISKQDLLSLLPHKQERQCATGLSLGHSAGEPLHKTAEVSSWVSKFPFQISPTLEEADSRHSTQHREPLGHRLLTESKSEFLIQGACKGVANVPSHLVGSEAQIDLSPFLAKHSASPTGAANYVLPQKTIPIPSLANPPLTSPWPSPAATHAGANVPSLKRDWNATLMPRVKHPQLLPDFFAQQKVTLSAKANQCLTLKSEGNPEIKCTVFSTQKSLASRVNEENAGFNRCSLNGAFCSDRTRNPLIIHQSVKHQDLSCEREALRTRTHTSEQHLCDSLRPVNLPKVKLEILSNHYENAEHGKLASREFTENHDNIAGSEGGFSTEVPLLNGLPAADQAAVQPLSVTSGIDKTMGTSQSAELMLFTASASTQVLGISSTVSACVPLPPFSKQSQNLTGLERGTTIPVNKYAQIDGDWGEFLAAPSIGHTADTDVKIMLPFQQRFVQLQKFLKKCDVSDNEYCLHALRSLSATARSDHATELESRARRLSMQEAKEMKRAKLLHVLEECPEGTFMNPCARPMGPGFIAPRVAAVVKEEA